MQKNNNNLDDIDPFNSLTASTDLSNGSSSSNIPNLIGFNKNDITITFQFDRPTPNNGLIIMNLNIVNSNATMPVSDFVLQAAVPKSMQLEMMAASSTDIPANGGSIQLTLKVNNPNRAVLKMRLKVSFNRGGQVFNELSEVSDFPSALNSA